MECGNIEQQRIQKNIPAVVIHWSFLFAALGCLSMYEASSRPLKKLTQWQKGVSQESSRLFVA